jgi:hypothetical protein
MCLRRTSLNILQHKSKDVRNLTSQLFQLNLRILENAPLVLAKVSEEFESAE